MKSKTSTWLASLLAFLLGAGLPALLLWNPGHWEWAERIVSGRHGPPALGAESQGTRLWTCGMHPQVIQDEPGTCPICGMDLVPVHEEGAKETTGIHVDPGFLQNFAVRTAPVRKGSIPVVIRTIGTLDYNQKNIVSVSTKTEGWIEKAYVNYIGQPVKRGDVLFDIYSPRLVTTQQEYLAALAYVEELSRGGDENAVARAQSLLEATSGRLRFWDITGEQVEELRIRKKPARTLKIFSPVSGVVIEKMGDSLEGMKLSPGMNVFKIARLSDLWARIEVYEHQIRYLRLGRTVSLTLDAFPGRRYTGKIIQLDPTLDQKTRTLAAYVEIPNPDRELRPAMYADVEIRVPAVPGALKVPSEAIVRTGERNVVIVEKEKGFFEPREVELGAEGEGFSQVTAGLHEGETVVVSSQFLIDSESNLKEAIGKMLAGRDREPGDPAAAPRPR
ncbi:MAG: efflux RND transporter periplasmic adaptor subunit [Acidobacteria bacterium]|nr:efflux RND transporter periplasmic adaptor subunit [Acidobacteriota bacterium]